MGSLASTDIPKVLVGLLLRVGDKSKDVEANGVSISLESGAASRLRISAASYVRGGSGAQWWKAEGFESGKRGPSQVRLKRWREESLTRRVNCRA